MAAGKPIVAVLNGEGAEVIRNAECGWTLPAGDAEGLAQLAVKLSKMDKTVLAEKGAKSKQYYDEHFVKEKCLKELDGIMNI
jgi:glycosyltransferase involved in cell wall biosynthesis